MVLADLLAKRYGSKRLATHQVVMFTVIAMATLNLLVACSPIDEKAPTIYRLPWFDSKGGYTAQDIELKTFDEPYRLRGTVGEVVIDPRVTSASVDANEPIGRWVRDGNRMLPADFVTQQAATMYAHLEKLSEIDTATGVSSKMKGVSRVGLLVRISESITSPMILNNAVYDGRLDALLVVPYAGELLPISQNAGIIGHEHFHRIFQSIVMTPIRETARNGVLETDHETVCMGGGIIEKTEEPRALPFDAVGGIVPMKILNQTLLRGVNEGFADFWGWAYSGDEDFVGRSLGNREDVARRLDKAAVSLPQKQEFRNSLVTVTRDGQPALKSEGARIAASYRFGTEYARVLRGVVEALVTKGTLSRTAAIEKVRLALALSLGSLANDVSATITREEIEPEMMLKPFFTQMVRMNSAGPALLEAASATIVCEELGRLRASPRLLSGLCK